MDLCQLPHVMPVFVTLCCLTGCFTQRVLRHSSAFMMNQGTEHHRTKEHFIACLIGAMHEVIYHILQVLPTTPDGWRSEDYQQLILGLKVTDFGEASKLLCWVIPSMLKLAADAHPTWTHVLKGFSR